MLLDTFFPRLQWVAWCRYGVIVTKRQFRDWREDDLLPGPAAPRGRGRGRSPERHWPTASYRRALRICRYKKWGAFRQSQWWIALWLSGETVDLDVIRASLIRELSIERRAWRSLFSREPYSRSVSRRHAGEFEDLAKLFDLSAAEIYTTLNSVMDEPHDTSYPEMMRFHGLRTIPDLTDIPSDEEISSVSRPGYLSLSVDRAKNLFPAELSDADLMFCRKLFWLMRRYHAVLLVCSGKWFLKNQHDDDIKLWMARSFYVFRSHQNREINMRSSMLLTNAFGVFLDRRDGLDPERRFGIIGGYIDTILGTTIEYLTTGQRE